MKCKHIRNTYQKWLLSSTPINTLIAIQIQRLTILGVCKSNALNLCDSPGFAQRNLPSQHENNIRDLSRHTLMLRRLDYSRRKIFKKFELRRYFSEKCKTAMFSRKIEKKEKNNRTSERQTVEKIERKSEASYCDDHAR